MNQKSIRIQGKGRVTQAPDRIRILFTVSGRHADFAASVEQCNSAVDAVRTAAHGSGIDPGEVKTVHFDVRDETEYISGRHKHIGFAATHQLGIVLPIDQDLLGRFLSSVIRSNAKPQVTLAFEVSDPESLRQRVLEDAVANAKRRAETIASAAGIKLGDIINIEYGYAEVRISSQPSEMFLESAAPESNISPEFDPDNVEAEDTVTITWEIGK